MAPKTRWLLPFLLVILSGCTTDRKKDTDIDRLWRAGYGFNNPNLGRKKEGLPPLNLDGSEYKP